MALGAVAKGLQSPGEDHPDVSGLVVDIPAEGGFATVVALTDDTTSMYMSTGGGTIGAGGHQNVASTTQALLTAAQGQLGAFTRPMIPAFRLPAKFAFISLVLQVLGTRTSRKTAFGAALRTS